MAARIAFGEPCVTAIIQLPYGARVMSAETLHAALEYARAGVPVFPCRPDKRPLTPNGFKDATTDEAKIRALWAANPNAMIGVPTGAASRFWVLDVDSKGGDKPDGKKTLRDLEAKHGELPMTRMVSTPSGGLHYFFEWDKARPFGNASALRDAGIDVRGEGGYVIAAPSIRSDGRQYNQTTPDPVGIAPAPEWLFDAIHKKEQARDKGHDENAPIYVADKTSFAKAALQEELNALQATTQNRNDALNTAAKKLGSLVAPGMLTMEEVTASLLDASERNGYIEKDGRKEAIGTLESGIRAGMENPRDVREQRKGEKPYVPIVATTYRYRDPRTLPPRDYLYGKEFVRGYVTATAAAGGTGKSALVLTKSLSMMSGKNLLGVTPRKPLNVLILELEDPPEELDKKLGALFVYYRDKIQPEDIGDRLRIISGRQHHVTVASSTARGGLAVNSRAIEDLEKEITENKIDVVIIDPFVSVHAVPENDNNGIDLVVKELSRLAHRTNTAIHIVHHVKKGEMQNGAESARGASALVDACRNVLMLNKMTEAEAERADVTDRWRFFSAAIGKTNFAPPAQAREWYELVSVDLENESVDEDGCVMESDNIGVVKPWDYPEETRSDPGECWPLVEAALRGQVWRESEKVRNGRWVGVPIAAALGLSLDSKADKRRVKELIGNWLSTGKLSAERLVDENRVLRPCIMVTGDEIPEARQGDLLDGATHE